MKQLSHDAYFEALSSKAREARTPEGVTFELTYGCNLRCVHCYNPTHRALPGELTTDEVLGILDQLADLGVVNLTMTGGELFTRTDLWEILEHAKHAGFVLSIMSNATRITPTVAEALMELQLENLALSIYGASQATYEQVTGVPGSYGSFIRGLDHLAGRGTPVVVRMPVLVENAHEIREAQQLIEGFGFKFQYALDISARTDGDPGPLAHRLSPTDKVRVNHTMVGYDKAAQVESACQADEAFISCSCGRNRFAITPYGEMILCVAFPIPKFDLRKGTIKEGWEVLKQTVDQAKPNDRYECPTCHVRPYCPQGRADAWLETGDMSACLPHYKDLATLEKQAHAHLDPRRPA